ncbi:MAG TPA: flagellar hook-associated protein FlgL [Pyrinomonadaceae bacterium]|nr:flagellar hook-associated protein FlgL [Pyrinomonadaceae bacterium]
MAFRVADSTARDTNISRINAQRSRLSILQERIASGKRINRPSDDPSGAAAVIRLKTNLSEIDQFKRSANFANQRLTAADDVLSGYENILERTKTLVSQGLSDTATQTAKNALATELEAMRGRILNTANTKYEDEYLFGGSRQAAPPFDPTTSAPNPNPAAPQYIQIEPGANAIPVGVTSDTVFKDSTSDIFTDLTTAITALRGTGNPATDRTNLEASFARLEVYRGLVSDAHSLVGGNMNITEMAQSRLAEDSLSYGERINNIEGDDFASTAVDLAETQSALDATLQVVAKGRRSLFDFLG